MASEERYLWSLTYQLHGVNRIWWAYFRDRQEAEAEIGELTRRFPCLQVGTLQEEPGGMLFAHRYYYHHVCSSQRKTDLLLAQKARLRNNLFVAPAPIACDYQTSFVRGVGKDGCCALCEGKSVETITPL